MRFHLGFLVLTAALPLATTLSAPAKAQSQTFTRSFPISYGEISDEISGRLDGAMNPLVRRLDCQNVKDNQYRCGEIPVGRVSGSAAKFLLKVDLGKFEGKSDGVEYHLDGEPIELFLSRRQNEGKINLPDLDKRETRDLLTSSKLGDDLYWRLRPLGEGRLSVLSCLNIPGVRGFASATHLRGKLHKKTPWYLPDVHAKLKVELDAGEMEFGSARLCSDSELVMDKDGLPKFEKLTLGNLAMRDLRHSGLKVKVDADVGGLLGFLNGFLKLFGFDVEKIIANKVRAEVIKLAQKDIDLKVEDVRSGDWIRKFLDHAHLAKITEKVNETIRRDLAGSGFGKKQIDNQVKAACLLAAEKLNLPAAQKKIFLQVCVSAKVKADWFLASSASRDAGCYANYFNPRRSIVDGNKRWWRSGCVIGNRVSVTMDTAFQPALECIIDAWNQNALSDRCQSILDESILDLARNQGLIDPNLKAPSLEDLEKIRALVKERAGIDLPPAVTLLKHWAK